MREFLYFQKYNLQMHMFQNTYRYTYIDKQKKNTANEMLQVLMSPLEKQWHYYMCVGVSVFFCCFLKKSILLEPNCFRLWIPVMVDYAEIPSLQ